MKVKSRKGKMRALAMLLAVVLVVTGIDMPFSAGSLQAAAKESGTDEAQAVNLDEPDTQEQDGNNPDTQESGEPVIQGNEKEADAQEPEQNEKQADAQTPSLQAESDGQEGEQADVETPALTDISGTGTEKDPYQIASATNLKTFRDYVNQGGDTDGKYFRQTNNIEIQETSEDPWTPIGTKDYPFKGTFQGRISIYATEHTLKLASNKATEDSKDCALFGENAGTIENLVMGIIIKDGVSTIGTEYSDHAAGIAITNSGTIRGCTVITGIYAKNGAGGIAFENNGLIEDCQYGKENYIEGGVCSDEKDSRGVTPYGGIVGNNNENGIIRNCTNWRKVGNEVTTTNKKGTTGRLGGIAGYNAGTIEGCTNRGAVSAFALGDVRDESGNWIKAGLGGIVGVQKSTGELKDCFNAGKIGVINYSFDPKKNDTLISDTSTRKVSSSCYKEGCIVGQFEDASVDVDGEGDGGDDGKTLPTCSNEVKKAQKTAFSNISGCIFWNDSNSTTSVKKGVGMWSNPHYLEGENIDDVTGKEDFLAGYAPGITVLVAASHVVTLNSENISKPNISNGVKGAGTADDPYQIETVEDLVAYRTYINQGGTPGYAKLMNDIDTSTVAVTTCIGIGTQTQPFFGVFDGNGKSITLNVKDSNQSYMGLFGFNCGTIRNLTVKGSFKGDKYVGAVAAANGDYYLYTKYYPNYTARAYRGVIENCRNEAAVRGTNTVGGIVGVNVGSLDNNLYTLDENLSEIRECTNTGDVQVAIDYYSSVDILEPVAGGMAGYLAIGKITDCENTAKISGEADIGGIVGQIVNAVGTGADGIQIENCTSTGNVNYTGEEDRFPSADIGAIAGEIPVFGDTPSDNDITSIFANCRYTMGDETNYNLPGAGGREVKQYNGAITYTDTTTPAVPPAPEEFTQGEGTEENPYLIENLNHFLYFAQNHEKGKYYKLTADVDLKGSENNPWTPIGSGDELFEGILDGDGHTVRGLYLKKPVAGEDKKSQGLFAQNGGTIQNLTVEGTVWGHREIGGIVGTNTGTVTGCTNKADVTGAEYVGGIAGLNKGWIEKSENLGKITGMNAKDFDGGSVFLSVHAEGGVGGIAGRNDTNTVHNKYVGGQITGCVNRGEVVRQGDNNKVYGEDEIEGAGGIVGQQGAYLDGSLKDCVNYGDVTGAGGTGGIAGTSQGPVTDCTNNGSVTQIYGSTTLVGGVVGHHLSGGGGVYVLSGNANNGNVRCEYTTSSGQPTVIPTDENYFYSIGGVVGKIDGYLEGIRARYQNNYFLKTESVNPLLRAIGDPVGVGMEDINSESESPDRLPNPGEHFRGEGTQEAPYKILDKKDLEALRDAVNAGEDYEGKYFVVAKDIDLEGSAENPWTPIGTPEHPFQGALDGGGHTVSGLYTGDETKDNQGLFGVNAGTIESLRVEGTVTGRDNVGGIVGTNTKDGVIAGCVADVAVTGNDYVGGIAGKNEGKIENCTSHGSITGNDYVGGIAGSNEASGTITDGVNNGNVSKKEGSTGTHIGGIAGDNKNDSNGSVTGSYVKNDETNKDLTGVGGKTDQESGVSSQDTPIPEHGKDFVGNGTPEKPYQIYTAEELQKIQEVTENKPDEYKDAYFELMKDIDLGENEGEGFTPIGTAEKPFTGTFNGNGHTVSGMNVSNQGEDNQGLFGVNAGIIENLTVEGSVTGKDNVGGIAGTNTAEGIIRDCIGNAEVSGGDNVGGIVGKNEGSVIRCATKTDGNAESGSGTADKGSVTGGNNVGGIAGSNDGVVKDSTNNADVTGETNTGGVTGNNGTNGTVMGGGNNGNVTTTDTEGGKETTGALVGKNENEAGDSVSGSYKKDETTNKDLTGIGGTTEDAEGIEAVTGDVKNPQKPFEGSGTLKDPYKIKTEEDLKKLAELVNSGEDQRGVHYKIEAEEGITLTEKSKPWTPIGTEDHPFTGTFDGNGNTVRGMEIDDSTKDNQGLFGVNAGTIENLTVEGSVTGGNNVGGIAGINTADGTIKDCTADVIVNGKDNVGGIAGKNDGTITNCTDKGSVTGTGSSTGGIAGTNSGTVQGSTNQADVTGKDDVGGITGTNGENGKVIDNINSGNVTGNENDKTTTGAVIGKNENTDAKDITGNYYQKTDEINKDLTGIGGVSPDPAGITSGTDPTPEKLFEGSGTKEDPYKISNKEDLEKLRDSVNRGNTYKDKYFQVTDDVDLGGETNPWTPIGTEEHPFEGILDGGGKTVSGVYINDDTKDNQGLFGVNGGTIENLTVEGSVTGGNNVGGIAGTNKEGGTIKDCTADVIVNGKDNVGGIAGKNDGTITDCTDKGSVTGTGNSTGGIAGTNSGTVQGSTNQADVTGKDDVGGITGTNGGTVQGSTNQADVTGEDHVGGITGSNGENGKVNDNINSGNVTGNENDKTTTGAVIGKNENTDEGDITGNYYQKTDDVNKDLTGIGGVSPDPAGITSGTSPTPGELFEGSGTKEDPYKISNKEDLEKLRDSVNGGNTYKDKYFQVTDDVDLGGETNPWTPIGTEEHPFEGILDGGGKTVSGVYINDETKDNQGLFGVNAGTIENLTVEGSVTGGNNVGGIAGINTADGTIKDCTADVIVNGKDNVGGIAGKNDGTVTGCTNEGTVNGSGTSAGGITGTNNGSITGSTNKEDVNGTAQVGGITGTNGADGTVKDNVNSGNVTGSQGPTGAVIGTNNNPNDGDITGNYYQKTDDVNKDLTGIGGVSPDPAGITSGTSPTPGGNTPGGTTPGDTTPGDTTPGGTTPGDTTSGGNTSGGTTPGGTTSGGTTSGGTTPVDSLSGLTAEQKEQVNQIAKELNVSIETAKKLQKIADELGIETDILFLTDKDITSLKSEGDIKGSTFSKLQAKATKAKKKSITLKWSKVKGVSGYQIYAAKCGKNNKYKLVKTIKKASKTSFTYKKLKKGTAYKFIVKAYKNVDGKKYTIAASKTVHEVTNGGKRTNPKSVKVNKSTVKVKKGKKFTIKPKIVKASSKKKLVNHRKISYESTNKKIATVSKKGVIKGKKKGTCYVYVYAENGIFKKVKVKVK